MPGTAPHRRSRTLAALALGMVLLLAGCGGGQQEDATTASDSSAAPVIGPEEEQVRLTERTPETISDSESSWVVEVTAFENSDDPVVVLDVEPDNGPVETYHLTLGGTVDLAGDAWRLSEIAISDSHDQPGSATLVRMEP